MVRSDTTVQPEEATEADLMVVHSKSYINSLKVEMSSTHLSQDKPIFFSIDHTKNTKRVL